MQDFSYEKTYELCKAYAWLGERKQSIIEFLFNRSVFEGGFTDLTKAMGRRTDRVGSDVSNIRKEVRVLESLGLVYIAYDNNDYIGDDGEVRVKAKPQAIFLMDGWMDRLIDKYHNRHNENIMLTYSYELERKNNNVE